MGILSDLENNPTRMKVDYLREVRERLQKAEENLQRAFQELNSLIFASCFTNSDTERKAVEVRILRIEFESLCLAYFLAGLELGTIPENKEDVDRIQDFFSRLRLRSFCKKCGFPRHLLLQCPSK